MSNKQKSINLFLSDGTFDGVLLIEDTSWGTGVMYSAPRSAIDSLLSNKECSYYGVYLLLSPNRIYIGQASDLKARIKQHSAGKDWWESVILMTTKDDSFTHTDIDYLEAHFIGLAMKCNAIGCDNKKCEKAKVSQFEQVKLDQYIEEAIFLLENILNVHAFSFHKSSALQAPAKLSKATKVSDPAKRQKGSVKSKNDAITFLKQAGLSVSSSQITYASLNSTKLFWANPKVEKLAEDWDIILNNSITSELIHIHIPANTYTAITKRGGNGFMIRSDRNKVGVLEIKIQPDTLVEIYSKIDLNRFVIKKYPY